MNKKPLLTYVTLLVILLSVTLPLNSFGQTDPSEDTSAPAAPPADPRVQGRPYEMPSQQPPKVTRQELLQEVAIGILKVLMTPRDKPKQKRQRGEMVTPAFCKEFVNYKGKCTFYQYTNKDFPSTNNSSAQAALASALYSIGLNKSFSSPKDLAKNVWQTAPPKVTLSNIARLKETLGTDWRQLNVSLDKYQKSGIKYTWIEGTSEIKKYLSMQLPVMIMLDAGTLPQFENKWWSAQWVTAFAYEKDYIYVSNFPQNRMTWAQLENAYKKGKLAVGHGTAGKAVVIWK
jgi:hypothetical protein